jgi:hypothetical protein
LNWVKIQHGKRQVHLEKGFIMNTINLNTYVIRASDGSIDLDATCAKFARDLLTFKTESETETEEVGAAVNSVFDQFPGARINMPALVNYALQRLNVQPENFRILSEKVQNYVRDHAGPREDGALFHIGKGKGGGVFRWADQR